MVFLQFLTWFDSSVQLRRWISCGKTNKFCSIFHKSEKSQFSCLIRHFWVDSKHNSGQVHKWRPSPPNTRPPNCWTPFLKCLEKKKIIGENKNSSTLPLSLAKFNYGSWLGWPIWDCSCGIDIYFWSRYMYLKKILRQIWILLLSC